MQDRCVILASTRGKGNFDDGREWEKYALLVLTPARQMRTGKNGLAVGEFRCSSAMIDLVEKSVPCIADVTFGVDAFGDKPAVVITGVKVIGAGQLGISPVDGLTFISPK